MKRVEDCKRICACTGEFCEMEEEEYIKRPCTYCGYVTKRWQYYHILNKAIYFYKKIKELLFHVPTP